MHGTYLPFGVTKDDRLCDGECVVQVTERIKLPLFSLNGHKELLNALQRQLITAHSKSNLHFISPQGERK